MPKRKKAPVKDLGMTAEEAIKKGILLKCYQILGKYYTPQTLKTAPRVEIGQCPACGDFSWEEYQDRNSGECGKCGFVG
jgi:ribosomal protein S27AE